MNITQDICYLITNNINKSKLNNKILLSSNPNAIQLLEKILKK